MAPKVSVRVFLIAFEATQVLASVLDVGLDVLVCYEFYKGERWLPFYSSVLVFLIAQTAYAYLFAATYARHIRTSWGIVRAFCIALPLAQLVPIFSWLETFHFERVDRFICWLGLNPTDTTYSEEGEVRVSQGTREAHGDEALWTFAQQKFKANIGFLVEAIVEAIPQAMIQTCVVVVYGEADTIIVVSILMSVFVVASKGYMLSYSIHAETFLFNALCVVADVCGLFATIVWAFAACSAGSLSSPEPSTLHRTWLWLALVAAGITLCGTGCLELFTAMDDHLKVLLGRIGRWHCLLSLPTNNILFDLWIVRNVTWLLALLPVCVLILTLKLSALPLLYLNSLQPSHFSFPQVNRRVYEFVNRAGPREATARIFHLNALLRAAKWDANAHRYTVSPLYRLAAVGTSKDCKIALRNYVAVLGRVKPTGWSKRVQEPLAAASISATANDDQQVADRMKVRSENRQLHLERELSDFERRSVVWWFLMGTHPNPEARRKVQTAAALHAENADSDENNEAAPAVDEEAGELEGRCCGRRWREWNKSSADHRMLLVGGVCFLLLTAFFGVLLVPVLVALSLIGVVVPLVGPYAWWQSGADVSLEATLGLVLSGTQVICILLLLILLPRVTQFQAAMKDIVDFSDDPVLGDGSFYRAGLDAILEEAYRRYREELGRKRLVDFLETKTNPDATKKIRAFLTGSEGF